MNDGESERDRTTRPWDISKISVSANLLLAVSILVATFRMGVPLVIAFHDLGKKIEEMGSSVARALEDSRNSRLDSEAALRDGSDQRQRIKSLEEWRKAVESRYAYDFNFIHGRIDPLRWHPLRVPIPRISDPVPQPEE